MSRGIKPIFNKRRINMARVRNNQGHRNKILNVFMRPYLEQENTQEREVIFKRGKLSNLYKIKLGNLRVILLGDFIHPMMLRWHIICRTNFQM